MGVVYAGFMWFQVTRSVGFYQGSFVAILVDFGMMGTGVGERSLGAQTHEWTLLVHSGSGSLIRMTLLGICSLMGAERNKSVL